ncbi:MAG: UvrD-helicase domain-containing protein [Acidobacteriia bacterium]|nr:UvrD-helicase domain-containing protein [Terriglobia bacterium]
MSGPVFTPGQLDAVDIGRREVDACIVAGPGSGKTTVLVEYFRRLVAAGVDPLRIVAITFTEKAALHMRKKLAEVFSSDQAVRAGLERAWVSTVHGFCARVLRENAVFAGVDPLFYVAGEREAWLLQRESISAALEALFRERPAAVGDLMRGLPASDFEEAALSAYDAMRAAGVAVEQLAAYPTPPGCTLRDVALTLDELTGAGLSLPGWSCAQRQHLNEIMEGAERAVSSATPLDALSAIASFSANLRKCKQGTPAYELVRRLKDEIKEARYSLITAHYAPQRELLIEALRRFDRMYREGKRQAGALDFADLEECAVRLLSEDPEARARIRAQFDYVLMDELQDTNGQQAKLLALLRPPGRFYAVGDINQSIFGFRHAEPQVFLDYRAAAGRSGRVVQLDANFRSRAEVLRAVETIVEGAPGIEPRSQKAEREFAAPGEPVVECLCAADAELEARWVARRILELDREFRDISVLVRNTEVIPEFAAAFDEAGVPYVFNRGRGFYDSPEVADMVNLLRVIANPRDEIALAATLRSPFVGVSADAILELKLASENMGAGLALLGDGDPPLMRFRERLAEWRARREYVTFDRLLLRAMDDCGYQPESGARGAANLEKFLAEAREASARLSLDEFVAELGLVREANPRQPDAPPEELADAVKLITVHSAKGLEFPVVFIAALHKGVDASPPPIAFSPHIGLGARWRDPARREEKDDLYLHALRHERKEREEREASRLLYVAMTRAEERLILSFSAGARKPANWAGVVIDKLRLNISEPCDEVVTRVAPNGEEWQLRVVVAPATAPFGRGSVTPGRAAQLVEFVPPPPLAGQHDTDAAVTALTAFANCPRAYYLGHYLGFEAVASKRQVYEIPAAELGTQVHALLAGAPAPDADPEALRLADVFRQSPLGRRAARAARAEREFDFVMAAGQLVIRGQIDLWFEEGGEVVVVDYKTDEVTRAQARERADDYAFQLRLYALALERATGRAPDRAWLYFLRPNTAVEVDLSPSLLDSPEQVARDFQEAQAELRFPMKEGERCRHCPFARDLCPAVS